ncbi:hypothetical protein DCS_03785 [Drechmeria coniospora]|uniref:Uncharacterized protein n=1 Tax=Drechmeria coniospora TaxID=98403 RepID=A0A151GI79_DRECN|nr:hypothetical protein DCS_03785 [Drechmeria coniospora]KYK56779.1 hypothetical protein DCS_03785 [Drechmeria coniospora]
MLARQQQARGRAAEELLVVGPGGTVTGCGTRLDESPAAEAEGVCCRMHGETGQKYRPLQRWPPGSSSLATTEQGVRSTAREVGSAGHPAHWDHRGTGCGPRRHSRQDTADTVSSDGAVIHGSPQRNDRPSRMTDV